MLVEHFGGGSLGVDGAANPLQAEHEQLLNNRYPYYRDAVVDAEKALHGPLSRSLAVAQKELRPLR